jgi:uncharacterized protein YeaO (DUF488 family)
MPIALKRAYEPPAPEDGYRVLVDRLWPRGVPKGEAQLDEWMKDVAPSDELRRAYHSGALRWGEFRLRYLSELKSHRDTLRPLAQRARRERVTLIFSSRDEEHNNALVLRQYLQMLKVD